uniref:Uncharacterized protein n=1 Tax=Apteryx owenii TaxID=8824 RepID=A0A8B9QB92_APTOW
PPRGEFICPIEYVHVLDLNSNVTRVEVGPLTYVRQDHERWVLYRGPRLGGGRDGRGGWSGGCRGLYRVCV